MSNNNRPWGLKPVVQRHFDALTQIGFAEFEKLLADHYRGQGYVVEHFGTGRRKLGRGERRFSTRSSRAIALGDLLVARGWKTEFRNSLVDIFENKSRLSQSQTCQIGCEGSSAMETELPGKQPQAQA